MVAPGGEAVTYAALDARAEELAGRLAALGVGVEDHLGVLARTRPATVELVHAAARLGAVFVPLNVRYTERELAATADRADLACLVCEAETEAVTGPFDGPVATVDEPAHGARDLAAVTPETFEMPAWDRECPQALVATSGTTGGPKLVELTSWNLLSSAAASSWRLGVLPTDRWYCTLPTYHMGGLAPVYRSVLYGTAVVVGSPGSFDPDRVLRELRERDATCTSLVPTMLRDLLEADDEGVLAELRFVLVGGAATPKPLVERAREAGVAVHPSYGMTEAASQIATATPEDTAVAPGSAGNPLVFTEVAVVGEDGSVLPTGETGELVVRGSTVTPGYYGDREATEAAFGPHGFHTGDAGYRDDEGRLWVVNRLDDRIVTGGENVDPGEVAAVLREHPEVAEAFVCGLDDERYGQRVAALLVGSADAGVVEAFARERLAGHKLPRTWRVVDALPHTASGTVDRAAARALFDD
jgi:O-succinylbenzoic acid--CoA ligase